MNASLRIFTLAVALVTLAACSPQLARKQGALSEPIIEAPVVVVEAVADCETQSATTGDGIGGTGCQSN